MKKFMHMLLPLFALLFMTFVIPVQATTIPVATTDDLSAKIAGAAAGDVLELADTTHSLATIVTIDKNLTITAAAGAHPIFVGQMVDFENGCTATWQNVDICGNTNNGTVATNLIRVRGDNTVVNIKNCKLFGATTSYNNYNYVQVGAGNPVATPAQSAPSRLVFSNVDVDWANCGNATNGVFSVNDSLGSSLEFNDCNIKANAAGKVFIAQGTFATTAPMPTSGLENITLNRCTVTPGGSTACVFMVYQGGSVNINQCTLNGTSKVTYMMRMGGGIVNIDRSVFDMRSRSLGTNADFGVSAAVFTPASGSDFTATNSVFLVNSSANQAAGFGFNTTTGGNWTLRHCNFIDFSQTANTTAKFVRYGGAAACSAINRLTVENCLFDGTSTDAAYAVQGVLPGATGTPTFVMGVNLLPQAAVAGDKLSEGTMVVGKSLVSATDFYTLDPASPAIQAGAVLAGISSDIMGNNRPMPADTNPDLGAFENQTVPVELSTFQVE